MAIVMYYTSQRNYMPGKEFGTARFENPKQVNKILADKDENFNRILSQNVKMSLDFRRLKLNGNILICGGSGAGKTFYEVKPNLMQMPHNCSFICTDPKGEILRSCGQMLKNNGYNVKVINLLEMDKSDCYNPFSYIREETDVVKLITNLISNTTPKGSTPSDPFWEKAEGLFLQSIFYYVWLEVQPAKRNFETVLKLLGEAEVTEQGKASKLDVRMKFLEESSPLGANHPAVKQYNKCMRGAGDTVRSIIISANSRLAFLENKQVLRLLSKDELNLSDIGIGVNGDGETKTALFCVIPDSDKSYNFIIGMLYTQIFQELYYQADFNCGGTWLYIDEFHVLLNSEYSAKYLQQLWKKVRKQGGLCTGITQNVVDLLQNYTATTMLANSEFVALLKQANTDSSKMAEVIGVSEAQLRFVTNTASGMGLIKCGSVVIPFDNQISKDTDLYRLYNTNIHEKIAEQKKREMQKNVE